MKKIFLHALVCAISIACIYKSNAQTGVTKYGTNALVSNAASGDYNTAFGYYSLAANTSGNRNTGSGANALRFNTTGIYNTGTGAAALYQNTTGSNNSGFGAYALFSNTTGSKNTALGDESLRLNTGGSQNTASGYSSLYSNTFGSHNTASGNYSLYSNTTGYYNTASGHSSLYTNTTGNKNTANGYHSLYSNTAGNENTANGFYSLYTNTTGSYNTASGNYSLYINTTGVGNTADGHYSLTSNTTGSHNTASGIYSLYGNQTGHYNTASGSYSLYHNQTSAYNTASGYYSLFYNTTGGANTALGAFADVSARNLTNATAIGYNAVVDASNKVRIGDNSVTSIGGKVGWTTFSDGRYKKDIKENVQGLAFINSLRPVSYTVNVKDLNEFYNKTTRSVGGNEDKETKAEMEKSEDAAAKIIYNGFVAQEVESAAKKLNFEFSGVDKPATGDGLYGLRYDNFISPLVKSVQELSAKNDEKDSLISDLQSQINDLKALITKSGNGGSITSSAAYLKQNAPNPFRSNSVISYYIPDNAGNAQIRITDAAGRVIKTFNAAKGEGTITIRSGELAAGNYSYTLYIDNSIVDTKKMLLVK